MATFKSRRKQDGTTRHTAIVRTREGKVILYRESRTFAYLTAAKSWAKHRELESPEELAKALAGQKTAVESYQLGKIIRWYLDNFTEVGNWGRTKQTALEFLERHPIAGKDARSLTSADLVKHVKERRAGGTGPATVSGDLTWIGVVLRAAKSVESMKVNPSIVDEARDACRELRLIAKSRRRERRVTQAEEQRLDAFFGRRDNRSQLAMLDI
jgi:hypothetical protein